MTNQQNELVQEFVKKFGEVTVIEPPDMNGLVQLQLGKNVSQNEGISLHWLTGFEICFNRISIGVSYHNESCIYITMFCKP